MAQNIYDDPGFFTGYSALPRSMGGLDEAPEWPVLRAWLPPLDGLDVLDLGCGFGWFCRWARAHGAARVTGIDLSERMLARARAATQDAAVTYIQADLEELELPLDRFGLAYSSLAFHYLPELDRLFAQVHAALQPGAAFVFSVEHPIFTAPTELGWVRDTSGRHIWPLDGYLKEGPRTRDWLAKGVIKQHRTLATYLTLLRGSGFTLTNIEEWGPTDAQVATHPGWAVERERPMFLLLAARR